VAGVLFAAGRLAGRPLSRPRLDALGPAREWVVRFAAVGEPA